MPLKNMPIRRKLMTVILLTSGIVVLLTCAAFITYELYTLRKNMARSLMTRADIIAANSTAALAFQNEKDAEDVLGALRTDERTVAASLYDDRGVIFATYPTNISPGMLPSSPRERSARFGSSYLEVFTPVMQGNRMLGTVYLKSDLSAFSERCRAFAMLGSLIFIGSIAVAYLISRALQKQISEPVLALAETARAVSQRHDYSVRARKLSGDELGLLTDAFNQMLTEIQDRNQALQESEGRMRAVLDSALSAVLVIDMGGKVLDWNPRAEKMFGWTREETLGQDLAEIIIPPRYREAHRRGMKDFLATGTGPVLNRLIEMSALRRDGSEFPVELSISPLKTGDVVTFCGFITDITERKKAEVEIHELNTTLEQRVADRTAQLEAVNKELEAFSYSVSHDLRAPLRHIDGFVQMLTQDSAAGMSPSSQRYLNIISESATRMGKLIDDLLVFSRMGRTEMRRSKVKMDDLVAEVLKEMSTDMEGKNIKLDIGPLPEVNGDRPLLKQVWVNLLSNALKYSRKREQPEIRVRGGKNGDGEWEFSVQDNGAGFDMQYADKLFGVFQRLHHAEEFEGTGIGLANVRRIIVRHGGKIWAEGKVDSGATFHFTLPDITGT